MTAPILPGAEPFSAPGGPHGALVVHGFTGNVSSMRPLAEAFAVAGFAVEAPLLPGHGTSVEDMIPTRFEDWWGEVLAAYERLASRCEKVVAAGLSMGGTLVCRLAVERPGLAGVVAINPAIVPPADPAAIREAIEGGMELMPGIGSDIAKPGSVESAYEGTPMAPALSLAEACQALVPDLPRISCPVLLLSSREDHVVPSESGDTLAASAGGPVERVWLERSFHVATLDWDAPVIEEAAIAFARKVTAAG
ncbi:MAG TPA: alpha/beta fold hydrolase [Acidimicrobiales bacterium]|nr:alpha/beta fold hydrolase [Acidimicrobiales bacterium]